MRYKLMIMFIIIGNDCYLNFNYWILKIMVIFYRFYICDRYLKFNLLAAIKMLGILDLYHLMSINNLNIIQLLLDFLIIYLLNLKIFILIYLYFIFVLFHLQILLKMDQNYRRCIHRMVLFIEEYRVGNSFIYRSQELIYCS